MNVKMKAPFASTGICIGGVEIELDKDGIASVPENFVEDAKSHGFRVLEAQQNQQNKKGNK